MAIKPTAIVSLALLALACDPEPKEPTVTIPPSRPRVATGAHSLPVATPSNPKEIPWKEFKVQYTKGKYIHLLLPADSVATTGTLLAPIEFQDSTYHVDAFAENRTKHFDELKGGIAQAARAFKSTTRTKMLNGFQVYEFLANRRERKGISYTECSAHFYPPNPGGLTIEIWVDSQKAMPEFGPEFLKMCDWVATHNKP